MANYTEHYQLHQWEPEDPFLRTDFNEDLAKIDNALNQLAGSTLHIASGSYAGTGEAGAEHPNQLTFEFVPKMVVLTVDAGQELENGTVLVAGQTRSSGMGTSYSGGSCLNLHITWIGQGLSWYSAKVSYQLNKSGQTYRYFAVG